MAITVAMAITAPIFATIAMGATPRTATFAVAIPVAAPIAITVAIDAAIDVAVTAATAGTVTIVMI
jgi:hypothetical protein